MHTSAIIIYKANPVYLQIKSSDNATINRIHKHFEAHVEGAEFSPKFKMGIWNGKISYFNKQNNSLPAGLWQELVDFCTQEGIAYSFGNFTLDDICNKKIEAQMLQQYSQMLSKETVYDIRDYQLAALHRILMFSQGIVEAATGAGKSFIIYNAMRFNQFFGRSKKAILIVPTVTLVEQMYSDFKEYGWADIDDHVYTLHGGTPEKIKKKINGSFDKSILITTWQSVYKKRERFFSQFDSLLVDEVHLAKATSIQSISRKTYNANIRIGFTGTMPDKKKSLSDYYTITGYVGPVLYKVTAKQLIDAGVLADINIKSMICRYPDKFAAKNRSRSFEGETKALETYAPRNEVLDYIVNDNPQNTLVLVKHRDHLAEVKAYLIEKFGETHQIEEIHGGVKAKNREKIRNEMDTSTNYILIGTYATMSTGVNIKNIHNVIFAASYKSKYKVLQSIGRGLRKSDAKTEVIIWDIVDDLSVIQGTGRRVLKNYVYKHYEERVLMYEDQGFPNAEILFDVK